MLLMNASSSGVKERYRVAYEDFKCCGALAVQTAAVDVKVMLSGVLGQSCSHASHWGGCQGCSTASGEADTRCSTVFSLIDRQ